MKWLKMYGLKDRRRVDDEIDFDNDVSPLNRKTMPEVKRELTLNEQVNEIMFRLGKIEAKLEILCKSK